MSEFKAEASAVIDARPEEIWAVIRDYRVGHPAILPRPPFTDLSVESGGQGAGTVVWTRMKVMGREYVYHQAVSEPEPGRMLVETDIETGQYSSFTLESLNGGSQTRVTITAVFPHQPGLVGLVERLMTPSVSQGFFKKELDNLAEYVRNHREAVVSAS